MVNDPSMTVDVVRKRFAWVGLAEIDDSDLANRYREIMAEFSREAERSAQSR